MLICPSRCISPQSSEFSVADHDMLNLVGSDREFKCRTQARNGHAQCDTKPNTALAQQSLSKTSVFHALCSFPIPLGAMLALSFRCCLRLCVTRSSQACPSSVSSLTGLDMLWHVGHAGRAQFVGAAEGVDSEGFLVIFLAYGCAVDGFSVFSTAFVSVGPFVGPSSSVSSSLGSSADTNQMTVRGDFWYFSSWDRLWTSLGSTCAITRLSPCSEVLI